MTLDEAIKHCEEEAEEAKRMPHIKGGLIEKCGQEHIQLAGWLRELKAYKEQEPCEDAISRKAAVEAILTRVPDWCGSDEGGNLIGRNEAASYIRNLPSVTPKQKTGKWNILGYDDPSVRFYKCSECHMKITLKFNYCPNCGAKMDGTE